MVRKALHTVLKVCFGHGPIVKCFFFFWTGQLFLITYPICDTARQTLYEREMLAPGAGHRGASGLISVQVIRQTGGDIQAGTRCNRGRQTEGNGKGGGSGDCGTAAYPPAWVCSPGGPLLRWTGMPGADNRCRRMDVCENKMTAE